MSTCEPYVVDDPTLFHWLDYVTFSLSVLLSVAVGFYYAFIHKSQTTKEEFLLGDRGMAVGPVSVSLFLGWFSSISFLGDPVEVYYYGALHWVFAFAYPLGLIPAALYFAPRFHDMNIISCFEFLETKYNRGFRIAFSTIALIVSLPYLGIVLYAPSLALQQVTGGSVEAIIVVMGCVIIFYALFGGMKAVVWTDTLQMCILCIGYLAMMIGGLIAIGGFGEMWSKSERGGRIDFPSDKFAPNPLAKSTFWSYLLCGLLRTFLPYISSQSFVQRFSTVSTRNKARDLVLWNTPLFFIVVSCFVITGLTMFAYFGDCDPLTTGKVTHTDQMVPLMMMETIGFIYGLPGLFIAGIFSASMSSLSSAFNSYAACILRDIIETAYIRWSNKQLSERTATVIAKIITVTVGLIIIMLALALTNSTGSLFSITLSLTGVFSGPQSAVFFIAFLMSWIDWVSCLIGFCVGAALPIWVMIGAIVTDVSYDKLELYTFGCTMTNCTVTPVQMSTEQWLVTTVADETGFTVADLYYLSPLLYSALGFFSTLLVAMPLGAIGYCLCGRKQKDYPLEEDNDTKKEFHGVHIDGDVSIVTDDDMNVESPVEKSDENTRLEGLRERFSYNNESFSEYI